ncbi:rod-binding protein [Defluviitalea phaphyphila]|uniref:rod-binding protein n=1 Tax=Defluviitalea phaphyphila TaxID=1473580 RepID=UPI0007312BBC|nr:rod-binding protein [Defluviitalea phaphyphila]
MKIDGINIMDSYSIDSTFKIEQQLNKAEEFEKVLEKAKEEKNDEALKNACKEFESYFIHQLFKEMRKTIQSGGLIQKSRAEEIFQDMLDEEYSKNATKGQGIGLSDMLYKQLSQYTKTENTTN